MVALLLVGRTAGLHRSALHLNSRMRSVMGVVGEWTLVVAAIADVNDGKNCGATVGYVGGH